MSKILNRSLFNNFNVIILRSMYQHPYVEHYKKQRDSVTPNFYKKSTGFTGLFVNETPHHNLRILYGRILKVLKKMPEYSVYRQNAEELVSHRLALVEKEPDLIKLENQLGMGQLEEVIMQAEYELQTAREILNSKAWEPLVEEPSDAQWRWPIS